MTALLCQILLSSFFSHSLHWSLPYTLSCNDSPAQSCLWLWCVPVKGWRAKTTKGRGTWGQVQGESEQDFKGILPVVSQGMDLNLPAASCDRVTFSLLGKLIRDSPPGVFIGRCCVDSICLLLLLLSRVSRVWLCATQIGRASCRERVLVTV